MDVDSVSQTGTWWRHMPCEQRFSATLGRDAVEGLWQLARTPRDWQDDLKVTYRRSV